jgi:excisionase family DNA binding protein
MSWLTVKSIAEEMGVDIGKVGGWIATGELTAVNVAKSTATRARWRIRQSDFDAFLASRQTAKPTPRATRATKRDESVTAYY